MADTIYDLDYQTYAICVIIDMDYTVSTIHDSLMRPWNVTEANSQTSIFKYDGFSRVVKAIFSPNDTVVKSSVQIGYFLEGKAP